MRQRPWFWATLAAWTFLGATTTAWALLWGPLRPPGRETSVFEARVNGAILRASFRALSGDIQGVFTQFTEAWKRDGWALMGEGRDFAPDFLGVDPRDAFRRERTGSLVRLHLFEKETTWRILGLYQNPRDGVLYSAVVDVPEKALGTEPAVSGGPAGLGVPEGVTKAVDCSAYGLEGHVWRSPQPVSDVGWLLSWADRKGLRLESRPNPGPGKTFLAHRGSKQYLVAVFPDEEGSSTTWCAVP